MYHEEQFQEDKFGFLNYRFYLTNSDIRQPLLVLLHGHGERGNDNLMSLSHFEELFYRLFDLEVKPNIIVPQCPSSCLWSPLATYNIEDRTYDIDKEEPSIAMKDLIKLIPDFVENHDCIDPNKIIFIGMSMGGAACLEFAARKPEIVSEIYACCPASIPMKNFLNLTKIRIHLYHGRNDSVVDYKYSVELDDRIKKSMGNSTLILYSNTDHNCWDKTFEKLSLNSLINK